MAVVISRTCDFDANHVATRTVTYSLDAEAYELDVCDADAKKVNDVFARLTKLSRQVALREVIKRAPAPSGNGTGYGEYDPQVVRQWAIAQGKPVNEKGRVPEEIVKAWIAAGTPGAEPEPAQAA